MKKKLHAILSVLFAVAMVFTMIPAATAKAAPAENTAFLEFASGDWKVSYWGDPVDGISATNPTVTGEGQYTTSLDFSKSASGQAIGLSFIGVFVQNGEKTFPHYAITIDSVKVNDTDVTFAKNGYTSSDDGITTRQNIYNAWVGDIPSDAHTPDGKLDGITPIIVNTADFATVKTVSVTFTYSKTKDQSSIVKKASVKAKNANLILDDDKYGYTQITTKLPKALKGKKSFVTYKSMNTCVASVDKKGVITAEGKGNTTILTTVTYNSYSYTYKTKIHVKAAK